MYKNELGTITVVYLNERVSVLLDTRTDNLSADTALRFLNKKSFYPTTVEALDRMPLPFYGKSRKKVKKLMYAFKENNLSLVERKTFLLSTLELIDRMR